MTLDEFMKLPGAKVLPDDLDTIPAMAWIEPCFRGPEDSAKGIRRTFGYALQFDWSQDGGPDDIIAYREAP